MAVKKIVPPEPTLARDHVFSTWLFAVTFALAIVRTPLLTDGTLVETLARSVGLALISPVFFAAGWMNNAIVLLLGRGHVLATWVIHWWFCLMIAFSGIAFILSSVFPLLGPEPGQLLVPMPESILIFAAYGSGLTFTYRRTRLERQAESA